MLLNSSKKYSTVRFEFGDGRWDFGMVWYCGYISSPYCQDLSWVWVLGCAVYLIEVEGVIDPLFIGLLIVNVFLFCRKAGLKYNNPTQEQPATVRLPFRQLNTLHKTRTVDIEASSNSQYTKTSDQQTGFVWQHFTPPFSPVKNV